MIVYDNINVELILMLIFYWDNNSRIIGIHHIYTNLMILLKFWYGKWWWTIGLGWDPYFQGNPSFCGNSRMVSCFVLWVAQKKIYWAPSLGHIAICLKQSWVPVLKTTEWDNRDQDQLVEPRADPFRQIQSYRRPTKIKLGFSHHVSEIFAGNLLI